MSAKRSNEADIKMSKNLFLTIMILLGSVATSAQAQSGLRFLHDAPITKFNKADTDLLIKTSNQTLDTAADGTPVTWENRSSGSGGHITALKDPQGRSNCRKVRVENRHQTLSNTTEAVFCKVDDKWKVISK